MKNINGEINFNCPPKCYWNSVTRVSHMQRSILILCIAYYELNDSLVSDTVYDARARQLSQMMDVMPSEDFEMTDYAYAFSDFTAATGFDLVGRLDSKQKAYLTRITKHIIDLKRQELKVNAD